MHLGNGEIVLRLGVTVALCAALGLERELRGHPAGLRTHALVGVGAALFSLAGAYGFGGAGGDSPTRVAAQVATGIGFIGAGTILRHGRAIEGLTSAASLWLAAALGVLAASGLIAVTIIGAALSLLVLTAAHLTHSLLRRRDVLVSVLFAEGADFGTPLIGLSESFDLERLTVEREAGDVRVTFRLQGEHDIVVAMLDSIRNAPGVRAVTVDPGDEEAR